MNDFTNRSRGQVTPSAAATYEDFFVPALFAQWTGQVLDSAGTRSGDAVLDIGCGTGVLSRSASRRVGSGGSVIGVDVNPGMLDVARRHVEPVVWRHAAAESLPFRDQSFDRVVSQFALMFFADRLRAVDEMARVVKPDGSVTIATWASIDQSPGYEAMLRLLRRLFGEEAADALEAPFSLGNQADVADLLGSVFPQIEVRLHHGWARFDSLEAWVHTDVRGWTLADRIDDEQYEVLLTHARRELASFVTASGAVRFPAPALIASTPV